MSTTHHDDESVSKNAPYRADRRAAQRADIKRARRSRRIIVHSEQREHPDVRKIARAIIAMAMADAEREAQAQAERQARDDAEVSDE